MISLYVFTSGFKVKGRSVLGRNLWMCRFVTGSLTFVFLQWGKICLSGIYIIYMGSSQAISNSIAPHPRFFSPSVESLGQKKPRFRGYTVGYSPRRPHIYITYIIYIYILKNCLQYSYGFQNLMSSWGSGKKNSKSLQVGRFFTFSYKTSGFALVFFLFELKNIFFWDFF